METEFVLSILSILVIGFILAVIFLMILWLQMHRKELKDKTEELNRPPSIPFTDNKTETFGDEQPEKEIASMTSLRSAQSAEDMEKMMPQKLMAWEDKEEEEKDADKKSIRSPLFAGEKPETTPELEKSSIEIRKIESENYVIYMPSEDEKQTKEGEPETPPALVAFENDPQIGPNPPNPSDPSDALNPPDLPNPPDPVNPPDPPNPPNPPPNDDTEEEFTLETL